MGCGDVGKPIEEGYLNVDIRETTATDFVADIRYQLPCITPGTIERVEAYDVLEHLEQKEILNTLKLWISYLCKDGTIVIRVPDLRRIFLALGNNKLPIQLAQWYIYGGQTNPYDFHKSGFDGSYLEGLLIGAGCTKILQRFDEMDWNVTVVGIK